MKRQIRFFTLIAALISFEVSAQLEPAWTASLDGTPDWHKVTANGFLLVSSGSDLHGFDPETGERSWSVTLSGKYDESEVNELEGAPLLIADRGGEVTLIDPFDGKVKFNSVEAGLSETVYRKFLPLSGSIVAAGKKADGSERIVCVNEASGEVRWTRDDKFGRIISINENSKDEMLLTTLFFIYKLRTDSGDTVWKNSVSEESDLAETGLGKALMGMAEEMAKDMEFNIKFYQDPKQGVFILVSENKRETPSSSGGDPSVSYSLQYNAYKLDSGDKIWNNPITMRGRMGDIAFYKNGAILMPDDGNRTTINFHPFEASGEGQYGKKGRGTKIKGGVNGHITNEHGILLISSSGSTTFLDLLDAESGETKYKKPLKVDGNMAQTINSDKGIIYITTEEMNLVDDASGDQLLGKSIPVTPALTVLDGDNLYLMDAKKNHLKKLNIRTGALTDIFTDKLKFDGKEEPTRIELREGGILVSSDQNMALISKDGALVYQSYFPAPRESGLARALLFAQGVRAAYIGANAYAASGALQAASAEVRADDQVAGAMAEGFGAAYQEIGDQASEFAQKSIDRMRARMSATAEGRDYNIILSGDKKENALLRVNKDTGAKEAEISLGDNDEPNYAVDDVTGRVFLVDNNGNLKGYQF